MLKTVLALVVFLSLQTPLLPGTPFQPWGPGGYQTVNAIEFSPDGQSMFVALFPAQVAKVEGRPAPAGAPEVALFESRRDGDRWSPPQLMPFAGRWKDYEASLSPDGQWMLFNSWRPMPDGREVAKNNLWLTRRTPQGWSSPVYLSGINTAGQRRVVVHRDWARRLRDLSRRRRRRSARHGLQPLSDAHRRRPCVRSNPIRPRRNSGG